MSPNTQPLSGKDLAAYEATRDLGAEVLQAVRQMKSGKTQPKHSIAHQQGKCITIVHLLCLHEKRSMPANLEAESTLTDRYQTTVPETVRRALRLKKRDKIQYVIRPGGEVVLTRLSDPESDDPVLGQFLRFLADDIANHPGRLQAVDQPFIQRIRALVAGVDVDLDAALPEDDE